MKPTPGSKEALDQGCECAVLDNAYGWGYMVKGQFWVNAACPLHGSRKDSGNNSTDSKKKKTRAKV